MKREGYMPEIILTLNNKTVIPQSNIVNSCKKKHHLSKVGQRRRRGIIDDLDQQLQV